MYHPPLSSLARGRSDGLALRLVSGGPLGLGRAASEASLSRCVWGVLWMGVRMETRDASLGGAWDACGPLAAVFERAACSASTKTACLGASGKLFARGPVDGRPAAQLSRGPQKRCLLPVGYDGQSRCSPPRPRSRRDQNQVFRADGHFARGEAPRAPATPPRPFCAAAASPAARRTTTTPPNPRSARKEGDGGPRCRIWRVYKGARTRSRP